MKHEDRIRLGRQIAAMRASRGWSQGHLAEVADCSLRTVQRAEQGRSRPESLMALATALDADVRDVLRSSGLPVELDPEPDVVTKPAATGPSMLSRVTTGKGLLDLVAKAVAWQFDHDAVDREEAEVVADLFQSAQGFASVYGDLQPAERVRASALLDERLRSVEAAGFNVLGGVESRPLFLRPGRPVPRPVAVVVVQRQKSQRPSGHRGKR